ncbi:LCP family protein [Sinomonas sp. ASV322]|uniref:LCP family protein n=1 Tax=Sinomonas sp. ASV322 TaxID=3041920 RepID=UPI0027DCE3B1|nr:LCP family protein [Sinomonas sp. ASV322]MDQ4502412.1 LCP family protein [Sinomonas sp. ASV322]
MQHDRRTPASPEGTGAAALPGRHFRVPRRWPKVLLGAGLTAAVAVAGGIVYAGATAVQINSNIHRSGILVDPAQSIQAVPKLTADTNILIMGMDSRLGEDGKPLPQDVYDALHAGGDDVGGYNSNVLMLVHIPADGSKATAISIPRDDYVVTAGFPGAGFKAKIKEAYGYALAAEQATLLRQGKPNDDATYQESRDAGRKAEIATVTKFLGSVHIDHFVEVTMAAFYQVAQVIAPITVCINRATKDTFSGADFKAGTQQIDAKQAVAFVRQRRDTSDPYYFFTDLDRERRQQAFIASVLHQLKQAGTLTDIPKMQSVFDAVSKNIAVDSGLDLIQLAQQATSLTGGNISFTTLPITGFGTSPEGASINTVDVAQVQATVKSLLAPPSASATPTPGSSTAAAVPAVVGTPAATDPAATTPSGVAPGAPAGSGAGGATTATPSPTQNSYADWTGALQGGGIPCVK